MQEITFQEIWEILSLNFYWNAPGPKDAAPLTNKEKGMLCGKIVKDLNKLIETEGEEYFTNLMAGSSAEGFEWTGLRSWLVAKNWFDRDYKHGEINLIAQWGILFSKAKKATYNSQPSEKKMKDVAKVMSEVMGSLPK